MEGKWRVLAIEIHPPECRCVPVAGRQRCICPWAREVPVPIALHSIFYSRRLSNNLGNLLFARRTTLKRWGLDTVEKLGGSATLAVRASSSTPCPFSFAVPWSPVSDYMLHAAPGVTWCLHSVS